MAGFEVIIYGRIWVITEGMQKPSLFSDLMQILVGLVMYGAFRPYPSMTDARLLLWRPSSECAAIYAHQLALTASEGQIKSPPGFPLAGFS